MISNAKDTLLTGNPGTLPNMRDALTSLFQPLTFKKIVKTIVNFSVVEAETTYSFQGVRQPLTPQKLMMKPEGQRAWKWEMIHCYSDLVLVPDEVIIFGSVRYRVMEKSNYTEYGYIEYHVCEDYT